MIRTSVIDNALEVCLIEQKPGSLIVQFDGNTVNLDTTPILKENQLLVPIRPIAQAIGASLIWNETSRRIALSRNGHIFKLAVDSIAAFQNGRAIALAAPPQMVDGRFSPPYFKTFINVTFGSFFSVKIHRHRKAKDFCIPSLNFKTQHLMKCDRIEIDWGCT